MGILERYRLVKGSMVCRQFFRQAMKTFATGFTPVVQRPLHYSFDGDFFVKLVVQKPVNHRRKVGGENAQLCSKTNTSSEPDSLSSPSLA